VQEVFHRFSAAAARVLGSSWAFIAAVVVILAWAAVGPLAHFSNTWQLIINTGTTIITFLMVFLIQNTQNRDSRAIHLKLDELLKGVQNARTALVDLEDLPDADLNRLQQEFERLRARREAGEASGRDGGM
jgi:low affinity Fe/Cu permease